MKENKEKEWNIEICGENCLKTIKHVIKSIKSVVKSQ